MPITLQKGETLPGGYAPRTDPTTGKSYSAQTGEEINYIDAPVSSSTQSNTQNSASTPAVPSSVSAVSTAPQPGSPANYSVARGDTLSAIANKYGTTVEALQKSNPSITDANKITAGSAIKIPTANIPSGAKGSANHIQGNIYNSISKVSPSNAGDVRSAANTVPTTESPITTAVNDTTTQLLADIAQKNSVESSTESVSKFYNETAESLGVPQLQADLMNIQTVMNGTDNDVRKEITSTGGFATESQVEGVVAARNKTLLLQASNFQNALSIAQQNLSTITSNYTEDRSTALNSLTDRINGDQTALSLFQSIQSNAKDNYSKILTSSGWTGLAQEDPSNYPLIESTFGLTPGTLSDPAKVASLQNSLYKTQTAALANQRFLYTSTGTAPDVTTGDAGGYSVASSSVASILGTSPTTPLYNVPVTDLATAIAQNEGYTDGSSKIAVTNNNPGNLKFTGQEGATQGAKSSDGGYYAKFDSPQAGMSALQNDLQSKYDSGKYHTIGDLMTVYSPDSGNPSASGGTISSLAQSVISRKLAPSQIRATQRTAVQNEVLNQDPNFNFEQADQQFSFGKSQQTQSTQASLKYTVDTLTQLKGLSKNIKRGDITFGNAIGQWLNYKGSDPATVAFVTKANGAVDDVAAALGGGVSTDAKLGIAKSILDPTLSDAAFNAQINTDLGTIASRQNALGQQAGQTSNSSQVTINGTSYLPYQIIGTVPDDSGNNITLTANSDGTISGSDGNTYDQDGNIIN